MPTKRRERPPVAKSKSNPKILIISGVVGLLALVAIYILYSNYEKKKYINETLSYQLAVQKDMEKGEFKKCITPMNAVLTRISARATIFTEDQKKQSNELLKTLNRQVEFQDLLIKLKLESEGEPAKSLVKMAAFRKDLYAKTNNIQKELTPFLLKVSNELSEKCLETQKSLFRDDYRKADKEWEKSLESGKFAEVVDSVKDYLEKAKDQNDTVWNSFVEKSYPLSANKYFIQNKTFEDGLAIYNVGINGTESQYQESIQSLDAFIGKVPLEYPIVKNELKAKHILLKSASRSRTKSQIDKLPLSKNDERKALSDKAFALEMPPAPKINFLKVSKADLDKISTTMKAELPEFTLENENVNEAEGMIVLKGKEYTVKAGFAEIKNDKVKYMVFDVNGVRFAFSPSALNENQMRDNRDFARFILNFIYEVARNVKLIDEACEMSDQFWTISRYSYFGIGLVAETEKNKELYLLCQDKLFKTEIKNVDSKDINSKIEAFRNQVKAITKDISQNKSIEKEVADAVSLFVSAISEKLDPNHFLTNQFAQLALVNDYFENAIPNCPVEIQSKIRQLKQYYNENIAVPFVVATGKSRDGSELLIHQSINNANSLWGYDKERNETSFVRSPFVIELDSQYMATTRVSAATIYKGKNEAEPTVEPLRVESRHLTGGILAAYDYSDKKFYCDTNKWNRNILMPFPIQPIFGKPSWAQPPHVLGVDALGNITEMFVPNGRFALMDFSNIKNEEEKLKAKNSWLDQVAATLKSSGELHLLFKYFSKYTFDSPIPNLNNLVGNNNDRGDYHQTVYQTIERNLGKKMLCDCDDLAEVYADILKRQGKLSFVMNVPGHATCGWIEKTPEGDYAMSFLDTGPPRRITDKTLDGAIEKGVKSYDQRNLMGFNARNVAFLFRFAGEQVRQAYYLDAKVMVDGDYAKAMIDVQESWHFHYYLQGVQTMENILQNDKASANYFEISGLYREMAIYDKAIKYYKDGLDKLDPKDEFSKLQSSMHYLVLLHRDDPQKVMPVLTELTEKLTKVNAPAKGKELLEFEIANFYILNKKVMEGFKIIEKRITENPGLINERLIFTLINIYTKLNDKVRGGQAATEEEKAAISKLDILIRRYVDTNHFQQTDDIYGSIMRYGTIFNYLIGKYGWDACQKKLKEGGYPKNMDKKHFNRNKATEEEDWEWIRLNLGSYYTGLSRALNSNNDDDNPETNEKVREMPTPEKWKEAFIFHDLMEKVYNFHKEKGLGKQTEYTMLLTRMMRGVIEKNDQLVDATLDKMKADDWTAFYRMVADNIGGMADLVSKEEFMKLFNKFSSRNPPKQHFLGIAYKAFAKKKYDISIAVAEAAVNKFRGEEKMAKEFSLLKTFVAQQKPAK